MIIVIFKRKKYKLFKTYMGMVSIHVDTNFTSLHRCRAPIIYETVNFLMHPNDMSENQAR